MVIENFFPLIFFMSHLTIKIGVWMVPFFRLDYLLWSPSLQQRKKLNENDFNRSPIGQAYIYVYMHFIKDVDHKFSQRSSLLTNKFLIKKKDIVKCRIWTCNCDCVCMAILILLIKLNNENWNSTYNRRCALMIIAEKKKESTCWPKSSVNKDKYQWSSRI